MSLQLTKFFRKSPSREEWPAMNGRQADIRQYAEQTRAFRKVNRVLWVLIALGGLAVIIYGRHLYRTDFQSNMKKLDSINRVRFEPNRPEIDQTVVVRPAFDLNFLNRRNIFTRYRSDEKKETRVSTKDVHKFKSSIRVVGITFDKDYEVLIEDLDKKETVLLTKGNSIAGAKLIDISEKKLIFELDNNQIEIEP
ncbi:MAG: hypothetical protein AB7S78_03300 [Candidatus Omnitrophota bacterium]